MIRQRRTIWQVLALTVLSALVSQGCACFSCCSLCWTHIDPTGNHIFRHGSDPPVAATEAPLYVPAGDPTPTPLPPGAAPLAAAPVVTAPPFVPPPVVAPTTPPMLPADTSGVTLVPLTGVSVSPVQVVAPVGSEVVMIASVFNPKGRGMPRQRIEWTIAGGGVGQFVSPGQRASWDVYNLARGLPKKVNSTYAINSTLTYPVDLTRGTPTPADDIPIKTGQAWVTVSSPVEGNTFLTAYAPNVEGWDHRQQTGTIYWLDAQWTFPPPAIDPAGSRNALSTAVVRQTDGTPLAGWTVRYEVAAGGPAAGFAPDGGNVVEVTTDSTGRATAEIFQHAPAPGTNTVNIQVIRPAGAPGSAGRQITVGSGSVLQTWTASGASLRTSGPATAGVGATVTYHIEVSNPGAGPVSGLVVTDEAPAALTYLNSNPASAAAGAGGQQWQLGDLAPGATQTIEVNYRVDRPGSFNYCGAFTAAGGLAGRDCVNTVAAAGQLNVTILGPQTAEVGSQVTFTIDVANQSDGTLSHVVVSDRFDAGLQSTVPGLQNAQALERDLQDDIPPHQTRQLSVMFQVTEPGQLCQDVVVTAEGGLRNEARSCLTVPNRQPAAPPATVPPAIVPPAIVPPVNPAATPPANPPVTPSPPPASVRPTPSPPAAGSLGVVASGPAERVLGKTAEFSIKVTNHGADALTNLAIACNFETSLEATQATSGAQMRGGALVWNLDSLAAGTSKTYRVDCNCVKEATKACARFTVTADGDLQAGDEACLAIIADSAAGAASPAAANLTVTIADQTDPVRVGGDTIYQIVLTNAGSSAQNQVVMAVTFTEEMHLDNVVTSPVSATSTFPRSVRFRPIAEIRPGEQITFELQAKADRAGTGTVSVSVSAAGMQQPATTSETTQILD